MALPNLFSSPPSQFLYVPFGGTIGTPGTTYRTPFTPQCAVGAGANEDRRVLPHRFKRDRETVHEVQGAHRSAATESSGPPTAGC